MWHSGFETASSSDVIVSGKVLTALVLTSNGKIWRPGHQNGASTTLLVETPGKEAGEPVEIQAPRV